MSYTATPSRLSVLMLTDIVGSTDLKTRLGLAEYARRLARHDRAFKQLVGSTPGAEILKDTGDGYLARFATTSDAVRAALRFQQALHDEQRDAGDGGGDAEALRARVGIHVGEVAEMDEDHTGKPKIVGLAADLVARVTQLAVGGQILLTRFAFNEARQFVSAYPDDSGSAGAPVLKWVAHGAYLFKGTDEPVEVFEVGAVGVAPLRAPPDAETARRAVAAGEDETLGWRPAVGLVVPDRPQWELVRHLGEGGFGEVWLARHRKLGTHRAFKFCFDADRLRSFKREITLFRLLQDALGDRVDIARLYEVKLDVPPYFLESEYTEGGNLQDWSDMEGGIDKVPLATRLDIVARVADAAAAAHSVGVLHKDIKPSNILIADDEGNPRPQLADFGIGMVDRARLQNPQASQQQRLPITMTGFTTTGGGEDYSSQTGTRIYVPPEVLVRRPFTVQGDVYALGVLLYQMVVGDLNRPLAEGWQRDVDDELLREDVAACADGDPARRPSSAADLAKRLRSLPQRRAWRAREAEDRRAAERRRRVGRIAVGTLGALVIVLAAVGVFAWREWTMRRQAERLRAAEQEQRAIADEVGLFLMGILTSVNPDAQQGRDTKVIDALGVAAKKLDEKPWRAEVEAYLRDTLARAYHALGEPAQAEPHARRAVELIGKVRPPDHEDVHNFRGDLGMVLYAQHRLEEAERLIGEAARKLTRILGPDHETTQSWLSNHVLVLLAMDRSDEAEPIIERLVDARTRKYGADHEETLTMLSTRGGLFYQRGRYADALDVFRRVYEARLRTLGEDHALTVLSAHNYGSMLFRLGRPAEAAAIMTRVLESQKRLVGAEHPRTLQAMLNLSQALRANGDHAGGRALLQDLFDTRVRKFGPEHADTLHAAGMLGGAMAATGEAVEAEQLLRRTLEVQQRLLPPEDQAPLNTAAALGEALEAQGRLEEALAVYRQNLADAERLRGENHTTNRQQVMLLGGCLLKLKQYAEAETVLLRALSMAQDPAAPNPKSAAMIADDLVALYEGWGNPEKASEYRALAAQIRATTQPATEPTTATMKPAI